MSLRCNRANKKDDAQKGFTQDSPWVVYMLLCADQTLYTGMTTNLTRRLAEHNGQSPKGAKYTASRRPVQLFYMEPAQDRSEAARREWKIKRMSKAQKLALARK